MVLLSRKKNIESCSLQKWVRLWTEVNHEVNQGDFLIGGLSSVPLKPLVAYNDVLQ